MAGRIQLLTAVGPNKHERMEFKQCLSGGTRTQPDRAWSLPWHCKLRWHSAILFSEAQVV